MQFAQKWFGNKYTVVYKLTGVDSTIQKVVKPTITPVEVNREAQSPFLKNCRNLQSTFEARISRLSKDINFSAVHKDVPLWAVPNKTNGLFQAYYVLDMGSLNDKKLPWLLTTLTTWALLPKPMKRSTRNCINSLSTSMSLQVKTRCTSASMVWMKILMPRLTS